MRPAFLLAAAPSLLVALAAPAAAEQPYYPEPDLEEEEEVESGGVFIALDAELFGGGSYVSIDDDHMTRFDLGRAEVGTRLEYDDVVSAELRLEAVRSVPSPEVPGEAVEGDDALTVRAKRAWGAWHEPIKRRRARPRFEVRGGLIPDPWIEAIESQYELRALAPTAAEHANLIDHSDLGVSAIAIWKMFRLEYAVTNGEGGLRPELNRSKNQSWLLTTRLPRFPGDLLASVHFYGRRGFAGTEGARSHRFGTGLTVDSPKYGGGAEMINAWGVGERDDLNAITGGIWAYATLKGRTGAAARIDWIKTVDAEDQQGSQQTTTLSLWRDLVPRGTSRVRDFGVRGYLAVQFDTAKEMPVMGDLPAARNATRFMVIIQASAQESVE